MRFRTSPCYIEKIHCNLMNGVHIICMYIFIMRYFRNILDNNKFDGQAEPQSVLTGSYSSTIIVTLEFYACFRFHIIVCPVSTTSIMSGLRTHPFTASIDLYCVHSRLLLSSCFSLPYHVTYIHYFAADADLTGVPCGPCLQLY